MISWVGECSDDVDVRLWRHLEDAAARVIGAISSQFACRGASDNADNADGCAAMRVEIRVANVERAARLRATLAATHAMPTTDATEAVG